MVSLVLQFEQEKICFPCLKILDRDIQNSSVLNRFPHTGH